MHFINKKLWVCCLTSLTLGFLTWNNNPYLIVVRIEWSNICGGLVEDLAQKICCCHIWYCVACCWSKFTNARQHQLQYPNNYHIFFPQWESLMEGPCSVLLVEGMSEERFRTHTDPGTKTIGGMLMWQFQDKQQQSSVKAVLFSLSLCCHSFAQPPSH